MSTEASLLTVDLPHLGLNIVGLIAELIFVFYAVRLLRSFKEGILEKGWKWVSIGAILLAVAQLPYLASETATVSIATALNDVGMLMRFSGLVFLILGFKAQYEIWRVDNKKSSSGPKQNEIIER
jgi:hypothetical protein